MPTPSRGFYIFMDEQQHMLTSPNSSDPPAVPPPPLRSQPTRTPTVRDMCALQWSSNLYPWLPYTPLIPSFSGSIFSRLAYTFSSFPIESGCYGYCLSHQLVSRWITLEDGLYGILERLMNKDQHRSGFFIPESKMCPAPSTRGYRIVHTTSQLARSAAIRSRDAFIPLMATISYIISTFLTAEEGRDNYKGRPLWETILTDDLLIHPVWVDALRESWIGDFTVPRVGVVIDPYTFRLRIIPYLVRAHVPVWIYWDHRKALDPKVADDYRPFEEDKIFALKCISCPWCRITHAAHFHESNPIPLPTNQSTSDPSDSISDSFDSSMTSLSSSNVDLPVPQPGDRQRRGESWRQFLERYRAKEPEFLAQEMPCDREKRLKCQREAMSQMSPGHSGPRVHHWRKHDENKQYRIRTSIPRSDVAGFWDKYSDKQRIYNGFLNEWDVCTEFDESESPDTEKWEDTIHGSPEPPAPDQEATSSQDLSNNLDDLLMSYTEEEPELAWETFPDFLSLRFGLIAEDIPISVSEADLSRIPKILGHAPENHSHLPRAWQAPAQALIRFSVTGCGPKPPRDDKEIAEIVKEAEVAATRIKAHKDKIVFALKGKDDAETPWTLLVTDPIAVLQCLRKSPGPKTTDIAKYLARHGIPFQTVIRPTQRIMPITPTSVFLGWRRQGYQPDHIDYTDYEAKRDAFLESPRARAALLMGGIVWRLAKHSLNLDCVLSGPSSQARYHGLRHHSKMLGDTIDDELTSDEIDLICGVYWIYTQRKGIQVAQKSWWPQPSAWAKSGLNWGIWTPSDEQWFQKRLEDIRGGRAFVRTASEWTAGSIRMQKDTPKVVQNSMRDADLLLLSLGI
jgi:hypothetical protein